MDLVEQKKKQIAAALRRHRIMAVRECFDPINPDSRPTAKQQEILDDLGIIPHRYVIAGNQTGKSQTGAREVAWILEENHPRWKRPESWGAESLTLLVIGRTMKHNEEVLWKKIESFLEPGSYRAVRQGMVLQKIVHKKTGNTIIFLSHHADNEAREKGQAFVAHYVWVDEMPRSYKFIEEMHRRIQARNGYFLATFTPKVVNNEIRKLVDASDGIMAKKYSMAMFDNPVYSQEQKDQILYSLRSMPESYRNTILHGAWSAGEEQVYQFNYDTMVAAPPEYSPGWRHVESVDPALKSKFGLTIWAEDPKTDIWYCIHAEYISGIYDPVEIYTAVQNKTKGFNITRRICDPHEAWYLGTAAANKCNPPYQSPFDKNNRKGELIKNLQHNLGTRLKIAPWCEHLIHEFEECRWSETTDNKIVNASSFHLLDTAQYFNDCVPSVVKEKVPVSWDDWLYQQNEKRKGKEQAVRKNGRGRIGRGRHGNRWGKRWA